MSSKQVQLGADKKPLWLFSIILLSCLVIFYLPWLSGHETFYLSDLTYYFEPFGSFIASAFRQTRLPLWNPYLYCGMPQIAVPSPSIFYPPGALFTFLPFSQALAFYLVLHQFLAGLGFYLLVCRSGWGALAASIAGFIAAVNGYMFSTSVNFTLLSTAAWLPLALFALSAIRPLQTRANLAMVFLAMISTGMLVAAGRPEIFVPGGLLLGAFVTIAALVFRRQDSSYGKDFKEWLWRMAALGGGLCLAMPIILPALEWVRLSPRAHGLELKWVMTWSANWYDLLCLFFAEPLGDLTSLGCRYLPLVASRANTIPYLASAYVGPLVLTLSLWAIFDRSLRFRLWILLFLSGGLVMAAGSYTPVAPFVSSLSPAFSSFRYPVKLLIFPVFALCLLSGRGAYLVFERKIGEKALSRMFFFWGLVILLGLVMYFVPGLSLLTLKFPWLANQTVDMSIMRESQRLFAQSFLSAGLFGLAYCLVSRAYAATQISRPLFAATTIFGLLVTLFLPAACFCRHGTAADFYLRPVKLSHSLDELTRSPEGIGFSSRILPLIFDPLTCPSHYCQKENLPFSQGFYLYSRQLLLPNCNLDFKIPYAFGYEAAEIGSFKQLFSRALAVSSQNRKRQQSATVSDEPIARFCWLTASGHVLTQSFASGHEREIPLLDPRFFTLLSDDRAMNLRLYRCLNVLPRAYFARSPVFVKSGEQLALRLLSPTPQDRLTDAFVELPENLSKADLNCRPGSTPATADIALDEAEHVRLALNADSRRLLVLADQNYPGWRATLDGVETRILRANSFSRAVIVPAGKHVLDFVYVPVSLYAGFAMAAASLLGLLLAWLSAAPALVTTDQTGNTAES